MEGQLGRATSSGRAVGGRTTRSWARNSKLEKGGVAMDATVTWCALPDVHNSGMQLDVELRFSDFSTEMVI